MCNCNDNCSCFTNTLETIVNIQRQGQCIDVCSNACDRPVLGSSILCNLANTRPVNLYTCPGSVLWTMPYVLNGTEGTSSVFRAEAVENCCATFRVLAPNPDTTSTNPYVSTNSFFTINLNCVSALRCLEDTFIACI